MTKHPPSQPSRHENRTLAALPGARDDHNAKRIVDSLTLGSSSGVHNYELQQRRAQLRLRLSGNGKR